MRPEFLQSLAINDFYSVKLPPPMARLHPPPRRRAAGRTRSRRRRQRHIAMQSMKCRAHRFNRSGMCIRPYFRRWMCSVGGGTEKCGRRKRLCTRSPITIRSISAGPGRRWEATHPTFIDAIPISVHLFCEMRARILPANDRSAANPSSTQPFCNSYRAFRSSRIHCPPFARPPAIDSARKAPIRSAILAAADKPKTPSSSGGKKESTVARCTFI